MLSDSGFKKLHEIIEEMQKNTNSHMTAVKCIIKKQQELETKLSELTIKERMN